MTCFFLVLGCMSGALAQIPDLSQPVAFADSTLRRTTASKQYDFYFSQKQAEQFVELSDASYTLEDQIKRYRFWDKTFTQRVAKGSALPPDFDDYVWIGAGTIQEVKRNGEW